MLFTVLTLAINEHTKHVCTASTVTALSLNIFMAYWVANNPRLHWWFHGHYDVTFP